MHRRTQAAVVAVSLGMSASGALAGQADPTTQELIGQINALKAQVEKLESTQKTQETRLTAKEVDATVGQVLSDADRRSQLMQASGFTAGYSKGKFIIQSEDGNFVLNPGIQMQARYVVNYRDENAANEIDGVAKTEEGLELRRMKLSFEGNVFGPDTKYKFQWASVRSTGNLELEEGYFIHRLSQFSPDWSVRAGQFKDVTYHEEITSSKRQLAVERSLVNNFLGGSQTKYIQGVGLIWDDGADGLPLRAEFGYTDGPNTRNTNFVKGGGSSFLGVANPDFGLYGRADYLAMGEWKQYEDFTAMGNAQDLLAFGAGAFYTQAGSNYALQHTLDAQYETGPFGVYAAYLGVAGDNDAAGNGYNYGLLGQAGYMLNDRWELFGRYDYTHLDNITTATGEDTFHEITAGVNYYMKGHAAKLTVDLVYLPDGTPAAADGLGILAPDAGEDQFVLRGQFQLLL